MKLIDTSEEYSCKRIIGVDTSTIGFAYAVIDDGKLVDYGIHEFTGNTLLEKIRQAYTAGHDIADLGADFAMVEQAVYINNRAVVIKLAYFIGIALAAIASRNITVDDVAPITWQNHIGNGKSTKEERATAKKANPGKSANWLKNYLREQRKQRTMDLIYDRFGATITDDNISDAVGIAWYAWDKYGKKD